MASDATPAIAHPGDDRMPLPSRLGIFTLFLCGVFGGLWQYADPRLTVGVLAGAFVALGISFLPDRNNWQVARWIVQLVLTGTAVWWVETRLKTAAIDLALIECMALLGLALLMEPPRTGYNVVAFGSLILIAYGGFIPLRSLYVPVAVVFVATGVWMLYRTRAAGLAEQRTHTGRHLRTYRQERGFRAIHFLLFMAAAAVVFALFPPGGRGGFGIFPVSFSVNESMRYPKLWKEWWQTPWLEEAAEANDLTEGGRNVRTITPLAQTPIAQQAREHEQAWESLSGGGSGTLGQALVFRVKCPEKLYWLVRIYDEYDGTRWRSPRLSGALNRTEFPSLSTPTRTVDQFVVMEKTGSPWLPGAFLVDQVVWDNAENDPDAGPDKTPIVRVTAAGVHLESLPSPTVPWRYRCRSQLPVFTGDLPAVPMEKWGKDARRLLEVPPATASPRVRQLALRLTAQKPTPYRKALALRDYLRLNYRYSLTAAKPPPGADPVEHFLFVSREGACAQFAQALTILARLAGLPARLATGYAPGNYNVVSGMFEVHEYHAHAWSQILISPYGWLTFDGVAPGNLQLQPIPAVLGKLRDPFTDEWEAGVPELAGQGQAPAATANPLAPPTDTPSRIAAVVEKVKESIVTRAQQETRTVVPSTGSLAKAASTVTWEAVRHTLARAGTQWRQWLRELGLHLTRLWDHGLDAVFRISSRTFAAMALAGALFLLGFLVRRPVARAWGHWRRQRRCARAWSSLCRAQGDDSDVVVNRCYVFCSELLNVWEWPRPQRLDLLEYGEWLVRRQTAGGTDLMTVFTLFMQRRFGPATATADEAAAALAAARHLHARWQADASDGPEQPDRSDSCPPCRRPA